MDKSLLLHASICGARSAAIINQIAPEAMKEKRESSEQNDEFRLMRHSINLAAWRGIRECSPPAPIHTPQGEMHFLSSPPHRSIVGAKSDPTSRRHQFRAQNIGIYFCDSDLACVGHIRGGGEGRKTAIFTFKNYLLAAMNNVSFFHCL